MQELENSRDKFVHRRVLFFVTHAVICAGRDSHKQCLAGQVSRSQGPSAIKHVASDAVDAGNGERITGAPMRGTKRERMVEYIGPPCKQRLDHERSVMTSETRQGRKHIVPARAVRLGWKQDGKDVAVLLRHKYSMQCIIS